MNPFAIFGCIAIAIIILQVYYIILHYDDMTEYVDQYKQFRYGIDIIPNYIDPTTSDYNDTIYADVRSKRRCLDGPSYFIASLEGYAVDGDLNRITHTNLIGCIIDMTENNYQLYNPCSINSNSAECTRLLESLK